MEKDKSVESNGEKHPNADPDNNIEIIKYWIIETRSKIKKSLSVEYSDYNQALEIFNRNSEEGKHVILYELQKSAEDGKIIKKIPVLNYSKYLERKKIAEEEAAQANVAKAIEEGKAEGSIRKPKPGLRAIKYRLLLLVVIVASFITLLFVMDMLAGGGNSGSHGHFIMYEIANMKNEGFFILFDKIDHLGIAAKLT